MPTENNVIDINTGVTMNNPITPEVGASVEIPTGKLNSSLTTNTLIGGATMFAAGAAACELVHRFVIPGGKWIVKKVKGIVGKARKGQEDDLDDFIDAEKGVDYEDVVDSSKKKSSSK